MFSNDEFLMEQRLHILRDPHVRLTVIVQAYKKEREEIEKRKGASQKIESEKKVATFDLPIVSKESSLPDSLEPKHENYQKEVRKEHKVLTEDNLKVLLLDLSENQLLQVKKFLPVESFLQQNRLAFNDLVLEATMNELKFFDAMDSISVKLRGIIESKPSKRLNKKEKLIPLIEEFFQNFPDPLADFQSALFPTNTQINVRESKEIDLTPAFMKSAAIEEKEMENHSEELVRREVSAGVNSFNQMLENPLKLYQHYQEICQMRLLEYNCDEEDLKEICEACNCRDHRFPSFFQCMKCSGEIKFCLDCIQPHKYGDNKVTRKHDYLNLCPICLKYDRIIACVDCPDLDRLKCQTCHANYHDLTATHAFNMRKLPSLAIQQIQSLPSQLAPPLKEEPFELSLMVQGKDNVNRKAWGNEPTAINPTLQEKINNQRVVVLLASVVKPILVVLFQVVWCVNHSFCVGCKRSHSFNDIALEPCISSLLLDTNDEVIEDFSATRNSEDDSGFSNKTGKRTVERPALRTYKKLKSDHLRAFDCYKFDYSAVIEVLYCFCYRRELNVFAYLSKQQKEEILYWRNETFHQETLCSELKEKAFSAQQGLPFICKSICSRMNALLTKTFKVFPDWYIMWQSNFDLERKIRSCSEAYTLLEIQEEFENIWMKDSSEASLRDLRRCLSLSKGSYDFRSKQLASLLIDKNVVKLLILPRFQSNGFDRLKYQFLTYIDWVGIIDLNDPLCWDQQQDHEFQPNQLIYSSAQMRPSLVGRNHKILYCKRLTSDLAVEIHKQLHLNDELHVFIVASGVFSSDKLDTFEGRLEDIKDESELKKWKYEIIPLYENFEDLMKPTNWLGEKLSYEEQRERIQKETCSLYSLNSFILANISRESRFILKGLNNHRFGFQTSVIPNGVDLWVDEGDKMLLEEEVKRRELSSEGNAMAVDHTKEVLRDSLEVFLKGGQAEKYLFARGMVVKRNDLEKLISRVKEKDPQNHTPVTVVHGKGKGGTTIARHALYLLQQEGYVCMEIKSDNIASAEFVQFLNLLADTMGHALIKIVIYFDLNRFSDRPSTLMHEILHGDCNAFTTILETTSTRTFNSDSSSSVMKLTPDLVEDEPEQFSKLLEQCVDRYITIKGHILPLDEFGELETEKILKNADLCEVLKKSTRAELSSAGLSPTDVIELKEALHHDYDDFEETEYSHYVINHDRHKPSRKEMSSVKRRLHFLSMRAYVPQFRDSVRTNLNTLLAGVTPAAIRLLKLCVFYTLFTHLRVPIKVAEYFYQNQYPFDFYSKSDNFSSILKSDEYLSDLIYVHDEGEGKAKISILNIHFAYCLAECSALFGDISNKAGGDTANVSFSSSSSSSKMIDSERLQVSIGKIRTYIEEELFESLFGQNMQKLHADQRFFLLREVGPGLLDAFCKFQIWHPGTIPDRRDRKTGLPKPREMRNSFLIEAFRIIAARSHMSNRFPIIRDWFRRIVDAYKEMKKDTSDPEIMEFYLTFTTYACRNIAFEAASTHNEQLIEVGKRLLEPFEKNYQVADALGNLCKHHLLIYKYKYCPRPGSSTNSEGHLKIAGAAEKNDHRNDDDDDDDDDSLLDEAVPADQSQTLTIKSMKQKLEEILVITNEGFFWFKNAAFFSNFNNSNPMVSAAQIITVCLETVRAIITAIGDAKDLPKQERIKRFIAYLKKPEDVLYFEGFLKELNREAFPDRCSAMLTQAKNSIYAGKRSFYEHYAKIRLTERLIARCNDQLTELTVNPKTFAYMSKSEITFPIIEAKLILGGDLDQVPSSASAWCIVACLKWIAEQHNKLTDTLAEKNVDIATLEVIEKYFIASALLAGFTTAKIPSALTPDEELERYLKAANLSHDTAAKASSFMEAVLEKWKSETTIIHEEKSSILQKRSSTFDDNIVNDRSYYGLKGRVMQIMIYIWKILYGKDKENSGKGKLTEEDGEEGEEEEEAKKMNVAALQESLKEMYAFTVAREDANKPSRFICQNLACSRIMPFNPFLHYFFIEGSSIGEKTLSKVLKENPIAREQEYRKPLYQDIFVTFHGRIIYWKSNSNYYYYYEHHNQQHLRSFEGQVPKDKRFTIKCHELSSSSSSINIGFADRYYKDMGFQENDEVSFVIGLTDRGIRAFGVKKVNGQR